MPDLPLDYRTCRLLMISMHSHLDNKYMRKTVRNISRDVTRATILDYIYRKDPRNVFLIFLSHIYCHVPGGGVSNKPSGLQAATRHGARDPLVSSQVD